MGPKGGEVWLGAGGRWYELVSARNGATEGEEKEREERVNQGVKKLVVAEKRTSFPPTLPARSC